MNTQPPAPANEGAELKYKTGAEIASAFGGAYTAFDVYACASAIDRLVAAKASRPPAPSGLREAVREKVFQACNLASSGARLTPIIDMATDELLTAVLPFTQASEEARRLDWLEKHELDLVFEEGDSSVGVFPAWQVWTNARMQKDRPCMKAFGGTLRAAIDAAMQNEGA